MEVVKAYLSGDVSNALLRVLGFILFQGVETEEYKSRIFSDAKLPLVSWFCLIHFYEQAFNSV